MTDGIQLFRTALSSCPYLDERDSSNYIIDPEFSVTPDIYDFLLAKGFRRSAEIVYRPACPGCNECKSSRIPVAQFKPNRSQRRAWASVENDIAYRPCKASFSDKHYQLYLKYTQHRHADSEMSQSSKNAYMNFLTSSWSETIFVEIYLKKTLLAVAVTDRQPTSLSALYTFFDPEMEKFSPGVLAILTQLKLADELKLDWLYLGYWIKDSPKMAYKINYKPIQYFENGQWYFLER